jgi:FkbM family methyltransferase
MNKSVVVNKEWQGIARSIHRAVQPTATINLLDVSYTVRSEARSTGADRDYAVLKDLAAGRRCVLDVGANLGLTALIMSSAMPADGRVIAFETSEDGCRIIRDNAALNGLGERISVVNALIAERSGLTIDFYGDFASGGASIIPGYLAHSRPLRKVTLALDHFVAADGLTPDLIKIDVEGAELRVLQGTAKTMQAARPLIFVELHSYDGVTVPDAAAELLAFLGPLDYALVYLRTKAAITDPAVFTGRGRCHVLLCPAESPFLADGLSKLDTRGL